MGAQRGSVGPTLLIVMAALLGIGLVVALAYVGLRGSLKDPIPLSRTADAFPAPEAWTVASRTDTPARVVCLGGDPCPSSFRSWTVPEAATPEEFLALVTAAGWDLELSGSCAQPFTEGRARSCIASGEVDGVEVTAAYRSGQPEGTQPGTVTVSTRYP